MLKIDLDGFTFVTTHPCVSCDTRLYTLHTANAEPKRWQLLTDSRKWKWPPSVRTEPLLESGDPVVKVIDVLSCPEVVWDGNWK